MDTLLSDWFAVQVRCGREAFSAEHLRVRRYEVFLPSYDEYRRWSDRIRKVSRALFDGYLFCRIAADVTGSIVTTPGVIRLVGDSHGPVSIPLAEIEVLQRVAEERLSAEPWPFLQTGQRVCIQDGPLRGTDGVVVTIKNRHRLVVSVALLQRSVAVELQSDWVRILPAGKRTDGLAKS